MCVCVCVCVCARKLDIEDRMGKMIVKNAFILFKDQKPNFYDKKQCRLINLSKTELGVIFFKSYQKYCIEYKKKL